MTNLFLIVNMGFIVISVCMVLFFRKPFSRLLACSLATTLIALEFVLYAVHTGASMYLDAALAFFVLGFMDTQFFAVYLRKKGVFE